MGALRKSHLPVTKYQIKEPKAMLGTVALLWCYATGAALALGLTAVALIWALDRVMVMTGNYKVVVEWYWDRCKTRRGRIITQKRN